MPHDICILGGKVHMMYVDEPPWHGLGTRLKSPPTSEEAIEAAHLNWQVKKVPLYAAEFGRREVVPGFTAVVRGDLWDNEKEKCPIFGIVSDAYTPVQNWEAFAFMDSLVQEGGIEYHTAGALGNGERVWMLAKLPTHITVADEDITDKYLLLTNDHRATGSVQIKFTPIRVVCQNTLTLALAEGATIRLKHHRNVKERLLETKGILGLIDRGYREIEGYFKAMATIQVKAALLHDYLNAVFPMPEDADEKVQDTVTGDRQLAAHFFEHGRGNQAKGVRGTLWAAFSGVTELIDHRVPRNLSSHVADRRRLSSLWFGKGANVKARAYQLAVGLTHDKS